MAGDMRPPSGQRHVSRPYTARADDYTMDAPLYSSKGLPQYAQGSRRGSTHDAQVKPVLSPLAQSAMKKDNLPRIRREEIILFSQMEYYSYLICLVGLSDVTLAGIAVGVSINDTEACFLTESTTSFVLGFLILVQGFTVCIALNCYVLRRDDRDESIAAHENAGIQAPGVSNEITPARATQYPSIPHLGTASPILERDDRSTIDRSFGNHAGSLSDVSSGLFNASHPAPPVSGEAAEPRVQQRVNAQFPNSLTRKPRRTASRREGNETKTPKTYATLGGFAQGAKPQGRVAKQRKSRELSYVLYVFIMGSLILMVIVAIVSLFNFLSRTWRASDPKSKCGDRYFPPAAKSGPDEAINAFKFTQITDLTTLVFADLVVFWALCIFCRIRRLKDDEAQLEPPAPINEALRRLTGSAHKSPAESVSSRSNVDAGGHLVPRDDETLPFPALASRGFSVDASSQNNRWPLDSIQSGGLLDWASSGLDHEDLDVIIDDPRHSRSDETFDNESSTSDPVVGHIYDTVPTRRPNSPR